MIIARQSTARTVTVGPVLNASGVAVTDGVVGDFKIAKNGAAPAALNGSATLTHRHTGFYSLALTASDLDTVGQAEVTIDDTVNSCPIKPITVIEEAVYDISFAASATGAVPVASIASGAITATAIASDAITAAKIATGAITASKFASGAIDAASIHPNTGLIPEYGTAQGGGANTITLAAGASSVNGAYTPGTIYLTGGTGADQWRTAASGGYNGTTKVLTVTVAWDVVPDALTTYIIVPAQLTPADIAAGLAPQFTALEDDIAAVAGAVDDLPTNAELATALDSADDAVLEQVALVKAKTDNLPSDPADQSIIVAATDAILTAVGDVPTNAELTAALAAADDAVISTINALNNLSSADVLTQINAALDASVADSIPDDGSRPSIRQGIYLNTQFLFERGVSGTTMTIYKPDGTTPLCTVTLNHPTSPTALTRSA